jgi:hypothetical protein
MPTLQEILDERDAAIAILNQKLQAAQDLQNAGAAGMDNTIKALLAQRTKVATQAYAAAQSDPAMAQALAALRAATAEMTTVAARMVSATTFITNVASLGTATEKAVAALKGSS